MKITLSPEKVTELKAKYNIDDQGLNDVLSHIEVHQPAEGTPISRTDGGEEPEPQNVLSALSKGDMTMPEAIVLIDMLDRKERRDRDEGRNGSGRGRLTDDQFVSKIVEQVVPKITPRNAEPSEELKTLKEQLSELLKKQAEADRKREQEELIAKVTEPMKQRIDELTKQVKENETPKTPPPNEFDAYLAYRTKLQTAGLLKEPGSGNIVYGSEGIPVSGSVPANAIYLPRMIQEITTTIFNGIEQLGTKLGLLGPSAATPESSLLHLPPEPEHKEPFPPIKSVETPAKSVETPAKSVETPAKSVETTPTTTPSTTSKLPTRPQTETVEDSLLQLPPPPPPEPEREPTAVDNGHIIVATKPEEHADGGLIVTVEKKAEVTPITEKTSEKTSEEPPKKVPKKGQKGKDNE